MAPGQFEAVAFSGLVALATAGVAVWFWRPHFAIDRTLTVIVLAWSYYTLSVPVDLWLGLEVAGSYRLPDLHEKGVLGDVVRVMLHHVAFLLALLLGYELSSAPGPGRLGLGSGMPRARLLEWLREGSRPPLWSVYAVAVAASLAYLGMFETSHRGLQEVSLREDGWARAASGVVDVSVAWVTWYVLSAEDRRKALLAVPAAGVVGLLTGARVYVAVVALVFLLRFRVRLSVAGRVGAIVLTALLVVLWKSAYYVMATWVLTGSLPPSLELPPFAGLAALEASDSWAYFVHFLRAGPSPVWSGASYVGGTLAALIPRALRGGDTLTLAERHAAALNPLADEAHGLGFSALAEAWLNFGEMGPALAGLGWGVLAGRLDSRPRGLAFYLFAVMSLRFFRTDLASLVKLYVVVFGGALLGVALLLKALAMIDAALAPRRRREWGTLETGQHV